MRRRRAFWLAIVIAVLAAASVTQPDPLRLALTVSPTEIEARGEAGRVSIALRF